MLYLYLDIRFFGVGIVQKNKNIIVCNSNDMSGCGCACMFVSAHLDVEKCTYKCIYWIPHGITQN